MPTITHYEIYTLESSGWVLHTRHVSADKDHALEEARGLDQHLGRPTKVVRETYDAETDRYTDQTIFMSPRAMELRRAARERKARGITEWGSPVGAQGDRPHALMPPGLEAYGSDSAGERPRRTISTKDFAARVLLVVVGSLVIATTGTALIPVVINLLRSFGVVISGLVLSNTLFAVFMVLFLTSGFVLTARFVPLYDLFDGGGRRRRRGSAAPTPEGQAGQKGGPTASGRAGPGPSEPALQTGAADTAAPPPSTAADAASEAEATAAEPSAKTEDRTADVAADQQAEPPGETEKSKEDTRDRNKKGAEKAKDEKGEGKEKNKKDKKESKSDSNNKKDSGKSEKKEGGKDKESDNAQKVRPEFEAARNAINTFLGGYVSALKDIRPRLDTYNRFGINLYLAGVCEILARDKGLTYPEFQRLLRDTVEIMGTRSALADSFVSKLKNYLAEDRYSQMVQHGREAMTVLLSGTARPFDNLGMVVEDWNTPKTQKISGSTIAIVFTDMVGSTDLTSEHGDEKAQQILRAHNSAVRSALGRFGGREIKHTGDGIMATFEHVPDAVWGMIDVLKAVRAHNQAQPEIPLRIRIGVNAGEPISAENDYYGLSVTIAARICAKADMDQIMVSQVVRDMCEGTELRFRDQGAMPLKGIQQPQRIHEALWEGSPSRDEAAADSADSADSAEAGDETPAAEEAPAPQPAPGPPAPPPSPPETVSPVDPEADGWLDDRPPAPEPPARHSNSA